MAKISAAAVALLLLIPSLSAAQVGVPPLAGVLRPVDATLDRALGTADGLVGGVQDLVQARVERLGRFVARNGATIEYDSQRQPARRGELLLIDPTADDLRVCAAAGYAVVGQGTIEGLDTPYAQLSVPAGTPLSRAEHRLQRLLPHAEITANHIYFPSGNLGGNGSTGSGKPALPRGGTVGVIDGGVPAGRDIAAQAGFAMSAPRPSAHAQAIRSLLAGAGTERLYVADVYGADPAGGNALAVARAIGWMIRQDVPVISISLVGPANPLVRRAIDQARSKGLVVVAAVGNDGPAAPPAYPASYPGVVAVTGVDRQNRVLFEAGKAAHLDYAAPGADLSAIGLDGRRVALRGTSFAAPLAAARIAARQAAVGSAAKAVELADREALRPGPRVGRGILCSSCRSGS